MCTSLWWSLGIFLSIAAHFFATLGQQMHKENQIGCQLNLLSCQFSQIRIQKPLFGNQNGLFMYFLTWTTMEELQLQIIVGMDNFPPNVYQNISQKIKGRKMVQIKKSLHVYHIAISLKKVLFIGPHNFPQSYDFISNHFHQ